MSEKDQMSFKKELATKNMRLAIILGLVAIGFYAGFIIFYW
jgi:hypothetical protein